MVGGVCAGLADRFDMDIIVPRILAVLIALVTFGLGAIAYVVLWARLPERPLELASDPFEVLPDYTDIDGQGAIAGVGPNGLDLAGAPQRSTAFLVARVATAVCLAVLFLVVAAMVPPFIPGTDGWQLWPVAFLIGGVFLAIVPIPSEREMAWHVLGIVITSFSAMALPMSLDLVSWHTIPFAFKTLWFLVAAGAVMLVVGFIKNDTAFMIGGAVCVAAFCLFSLVFLSIPGGTTNLILVVPQGSLRIVPF